MSARRAPTVEATRRTLLGAAVALAAFAPAVPATAPQPIQLGEPPPGKAQIVFYRRTEYPGGALTFTVREGTVGLGRLSSGSYFVATVDPGWHTYMVVAERHDKMQIDVEAGETYYVRFELDTGILLYQPTLVPAEEWQFDELAPRLKASAPLTAPEALAAPVAPK